VYWIIDLVKQQVEVYDNLQGIEYLDKKIFSKEERIPFPIIEVGFVLSEIL
jgi:Uma2 family endonuclease